jgi:hypothetical protein
MVEDKTQTATIIAASGPNDVGSCRSLTWYCRCLYVHLHVYMHYIRSMSIVDLFDAG